MYPDMMLKSVLERDKLSKTMIFFQGVYDTLDLFTDSLIEAFSSGKKQRRTVEAVGEV